MATKAPSSSSGGGRRSRKRSAPGDTGIGEVVVGVGGEGAASSSSSRAASSSSSRPRTRRPPPPPPGHFGPIAFAESLSVLGLYTTAGPPSASPESATGPPTDGGDATDEGRSSQKEAANGDGDGERSDEPPPPLSPTVLSDGAMEGLRLCHERFLAVVAGGIADLHGAAEEEEEEASASASAGGKKVSRKKKRSSSASKITSAEDVQGVLEALGFGDIGQEAARCVAEAERREAAAAAAAAAEEELPAAGKKGDAAAAGATPSSSSATAARKPQARRKKKRGPLKVTAEMVAEQERLLAKSAEEVRRRHGQDTAK